MGASTTASFLATLLVHAALWFAAAWGLARVLRSAVWRARLWRGAALGGVLSAALALGLDTTRLEWSWSRASAPQPPRSVATQTAGEGLPIVLSGSAPASEPAAASTPVPLSPGVAAWSWSEVAVGLWALGALAALARMALDRRRLARALARRRPLSDAAWRDDLRELSRSAGLARAPRLSVAEGLSSPLALARGEVVVPARAVRELARDEQRALLAHELAHLARRDPHWLAALGLVERVFWFQPLLRVASRRASAAAELCCDEAAARWTGAGVALARCLANVAGWVGARAPERVAVAMAARGSALVERVERLLVPQRARAFEGALCATCALLMLAALACSGPTAREEQQSDGEAVAELLRGRIDPEGKQELGIEFLGGSRFEVRIPPERIAELRQEAEQREQAGPPSLTEVQDAIRMAAIDQDPPAAELQALSALGYVALPEEHAEVTRVLWILDDCPEAAIAFHVPYRDGRFADSVMVPGGHAFELAGDGSLWCGDMLLARADGGDDRLLAFHMEEIARCARDGGAAALPSGRLDVVLRDQAPFTSLQRVLEQGGRKGTELAHYRLLRMDGARLVESLNYSLPTEADLEADAQGEELEIRVGAETDGNGRRSVTYSISGTHGRSQIRSPEPDASRLEDQLLRTTGRLTDAPVVIDASPGTVYSDVRLVVEVLVRVGFTDIRFVGRR